MADYTWDDLASELNPTEDAPQQVVTTAPTVNKIADIFQNAMKSNKSGNMLEALQQVQQLTSAGDIQPVTNQSDFPVDKLNQITEIVPEAVRGLATKTPLGHDVQTGLPLADEDLAQNFMQLAQLQGVRQRENLPQGQDMGALSFLDSLLNLGGGRGPAMITPDVQGAFDQSDVVRDSLQSLFGANDGTVSF